MNPIVSNFRPVDGASLVPDYSNANKLAMGIATQIKEGKVKQAVEEESASLQTALSNQNLEDIMNDPVLKNKLLRLYKIDAGIATGLLDVMKSGDAIALARETEATQEALDFYNGIKSLSEVEGVKTAKNLVRETIIERDFASANNPDVDLPTDKLKKLLIMQEDDFESELSLNIVKAGGVLSALPAPKDNFNNITTLRKEFAAETKPFLGVNDAYGRIKASASDPSPAGDLALIFNYMKVLDPGSSVMEGEFANAQNSGSVGERVMATYNNVLKGERLADTQRQDFVSRADKLYRQAVQTHKKRKAQYTKLAETYGFDPDQVVLDRVLFDIEPVTAEQLQAEAQAAIDNGADPDKVNAELQADLENLNGQV